MSPTDFNPKSGRWQGCQKAFQGISKILEDKKMANKVMKLIDPETGLMECKICGAKHWVQIRPDSKGKNYSGFWQCLNGFNIDHEQK
jgi:hypothetical protein